ncbi:ATP-grasp fold amidoligase family protein [Exiguobacterium alkaliphilum]|uniref:ATP-grasp fold amidoligase family protein n=1 Tax=Exiguobacterium alkaliphilum TaxID=1428684 RepID=UPI00403AAF42
MLIKEIINKKYIKKIYPVLNLLPDKLMIQFQYFASVGRFINFNNPQRFTEKIQMYKLNYKNSLMTICADKFAMRSYVEGLGYTELLPKIYNVFDSIEEVDYKALPNTFALKCNNGSGTNLFVQNKKEYSEIKLKEKIDSWKDVTTLNIGREWAYKNIPQKIVVEELLEPEDEFQKKHGLNDYKFLCFNGKVEYIWVDINRRSNHCRNFYSTEWEFLEVETDKPNFSSTIEKPIGYNKMLELAEIIGKDFPFVRVDFYSLNSKVYIGEITFYPWSGCVKFKPDSFDFELGNFFTEKRIEESS